MESDQVVSSLSDLVHSSTKLLEQTSPSAQFPPLQRSLDQLETLSKKLKAKTLRNDAPSQSTAATRLLAREGINAEQLARDLKSFELKTTIEDVFPAEAASIEEYLQQVHEMAMVTAIQEAQKDNLRSFNNYMMKVLQEDWQREKRDFLQSLSKISSLPRTNLSHTSNRMIFAGHSLQAPSRPVYSNTTNMEIVPFDDKPVLDRKAIAYADVVKNLNNAREHGLPFKPESAFKAAYESLGFQSSFGKTVNMNKIWHLVQTMMGDNSTLPPMVSKKMSLVNGARRHLEWGHEKYIMDVIQSHPAQASLGGAVGNLPKIRSFLRIRLRDYGVLDFDADDNWRHPPVDTTWQQIYFCLRTGYYDEAKNVALSSRVSHQFAPLLTEWISYGGMVSAEIAAAASEECDKMLRIGDRFGRTSYDKKKLLLYVLVSGSRRLVERMLRELATIFNTIEDFLWYKLATVRDIRGESSTSISNDCYAPYSVDDLQSYLNKFEPSYYTKNGKDPLVYPYILFLSLQLVPAVQVLLKEKADEGCDIDAIHISIVLADRGILSEGSGATKRLGLMDACSEVSSIIRQYGAAFLRQGNLTMALEYYAQAAAAIGGGELSWTGRANVDQQRQRTMMLKQLLTELLLREGGIQLLLGPQGFGEYGELTRFFTDTKLRQQFLLEAARQCQEVGLHDKSIEIHKRIGAFSMALETINECLSEAVNAFSRGRLDGESRTAGLIYSGNEILETYKYSSEVSTQDLSSILEQETVLRQLEAILSIHKLAKLGNHSDALREIAKLPFLPLDPRAPDNGRINLEDLSPHVQACVSDLLKVALTCLDVVSDTDGSLRAMRAKIAHFLASNMNRNWPRDLYERVARQL